MRRVSFFILTVFISGCVTVKNPTIKQVAGDWEHVSLGYSRLELNVNGQGYLVIPSDEDETRVYFVSNFVSNEEGFTVSWLDINIEDAKPETVEATLFEHGALCFNEFDYEDAELLCFLKVSEVDSSRNKSIRILDDLNNKRP